MAIRGLVDNLVGKNKISGWAYENTASSAVTLRVKKHGRLIGAGQASDLRRDLSRVNDGRVGFSITCLESVSELDLLFGVVDIIASTDEGEVASLEIWKNLRDVLEHRYIAAAISTYSKEQLASLLEAAQQNVRRQDTVLRTALQAASTILKRPESSEVRSEPKEEDLSVVFLRSGLKSSDGSAIVGRNGQLFLVGGSNGAISLYSRPIEEAQEVASAWAELFRRGLFRCPRFIA
jgi:hypothetical protein